MALRARGKASKDSAPSSAPAPDIADVAAASFRRPRGAEAAAELSAQRLTRQEQAREERAREQAQQQGQPDFPAVPISTIANLAIHSVLMLILPLGLYYSAVHGLLDPVFAPAFGAVRRENRPLLGGVLAVLGVNAVVVSFLVRAFSEVESGGGGAGASRRGAGGAGTSRKRD